MKPAKTRTGRWRAGIGGGVIALLAASIGVAAADPPAGTADPGVRDGSLLLAQAAQLPHLPSLSPKVAAADWLVAPVRSKAGVYLGQQSNEIALWNGLVRRVFRLTPGCATVSLDLLSENRSLLRAVKPEAMLTLDGREHAVGGLVGQPERAYLPADWVDALKTDPAAFRCVGFYTGETEAPFGWDRKRRAPDAPWPTPGARLSFVYEPPKGVHPGLTVTVHYELYDGLPVFCKWLTITNESAQTVTLDSFTSELLAAVEGESAVDERRPGEWRLPPVQLLTDYSFAGMDLVTARRAAEWLPDPDYGSQVNYQRKTPCLGIARPPIGPDQVLPKGATFESFRTFVLVHDGEGRERQGLALRRTLRGIAPWILENPIMMHVRSAESPAFRRAVDQCADVGFEMIIYTFGSGLDMENDDPAYLARIKADVEYAHSRNVQVGAYSLLASRRIDDQQDVINPQTGKTGGAVFGNSPCLGSRWADTYFRKIQRFIQQTGLDLLEHDGSYPGDVCASTNHPGHRGLKDSQWAQWSRISAFYRWCRERGIYLNVPDYYFLNGSSKTGMGYRESNWSLPREYQVILGRQNLFDGTWEKTPSMGWMFVPLVEYQGGGAAATLEPLHEHRDMYEAHLANNFGAGVQACYRGPRLYDTLETRALVRKWVVWFKRYRSILEADIIHVRRADGRDIDCLLHADPRQSTKGLAVVYNPLDVSVRKNLRLPLYYTGLTRTARIREQEGATRVYWLNHDYEVDLSLNLPARSMTWYLIE